MLSDDLEEYFRNRAKHMRELAKQSRSPLGRKDLLDLANGYAHSAATVVQSSVKAAIFK